MVGKERGLVIVFTGNGKGKTTAALGLALRAWGHEMKVLVLQFIKGQICGEHLAADKLNKCIEIRPLGLGFINFNDPAAVDQQKEKAKEAIKLAGQAMAEGHHILILDEILYALKYGLVELEQVINLIKSKPEELHLILTGRDAPSEIIALADLVTEMKEIKHPYKENIPAQKGIEY
ncbi:hypothetical protein N752_15420 [Desulforamulus aquiferis]|nr:hypothetical protein N752_15420 [Desulforamulus aquiferis]